MGKRVPKVTKRRLDSRKPHIRYNFEPKARGVEDEIAMESEHTMSFYFVVLAQNPTEVAGLILAELKKYTNSLEMKTSPAPQATGKKGLSYVIRACDVNTKPDAINWGLFGERHKMNIKQDPKLKGDTRTLVDYVSHTYHTY